MLTFLFGLFVGAIICSTIIVSVAVRRDENLKSEAVREFVVGLENSKARFGELGIYVLWEDILDEMEGELNDR